MFVTAAVVDVGMALGHARRCERQEWEWIFVRCSSAVVGL